MKKIHNKSYHDKLAKKHHIHELKRKNKEYSGFTMPDTKDNSDPSIYKAVSSKRTTKKLTTPKEFSLIYNTNKSLEFFEDFIYYSEKVDHIKIDMRHTEEMTIEVLLYLISLHKINKNKNIKINISIKPPKVKDLVVLMSQSGFSKYFKARVEVEVNDENIFEIQDKESNKKDGVFDEQTCENAIEFALKFYPGEKYNQPKFRHMFNALAEMMTNTDDHAYDEDGELRNWYLFAVKLEQGLSFYFFDNGKGVLKTAKKRILEEALEKIPFSYGHKSLMQSVLNGEFRSATKKKYRNKGLPEINEFLTNDTVLLPLILTNRVYTNPNEKKYYKIDHNFRGTLFVWMLKEQERPDAKN